MGVGAVAVGEEGDAGFLVAVAGDEGSEAGDGAAMGEVGFVVTLGNPPGEAIAGGFVEPAAAKGAGELVVDGQGVL